MLSKEWETGSVFVNSDLKYKPKMSLLKEIEHISNKEVLKAKELMASTLQDLYKAGLNEHALLLDGIQKEMRVAKAAIHSVSSFVKSVAAIRCRLTVASTRLLAGLTAVLAPQPHPSAGHQVSQREFSSTFGFQRQAKYFQAGLANREKQNQYINLPDEIKEGDLVVCRGCPGTLLRKCPDGLCTVKLRPWGTEVTYPTLTSAKMQPQAPVLDEFNTKERKDVTPTHVKDTIENFCGHVPISPNKQDTVKMRHPIFPSQYQSRQAMH